jgi:hypothetical protein
MRVEVELSERAEQFLGPNQAQTLARLAEKEALRLWHIERSKPKERAVRPVGRPRLSPQVKKAREIADWLGRVYITLQERFSKAGFEEMHGEDYARLRKATAEDDLDTLLGFEKEKPWQKKSEARQNVSLSSSQDQK